MTDPINPQDHSIRGISVEDAARRRIDGLFDGRPMSMYTDALCEAIHKTFERDEYHLGEIAKHEAWVEAGSRPGERPDIGKPRLDPDTEIDRLARLIVDGEYRRRKSAHEGNVE